MSINEYLLKMLIINWCRNPDSLGYTIDFTNQFLGTVYCFMPQDTIKRKYFLSLIK